MVTSVTSAPLLLLTLSSHQKKTHAHTEKREMKQRRQHASGPTSGQVAKHTETPSTNDAGGNELTNNNGLNDNDE